MIALDTAGGTYARSANSTSSNHTFNNSAGTTLVVGFALNNATNVFTTATYNGVGITIAKSQTATGEYDYIGYLSNPSTGSNTLTVNRSSNQVCDIGIASYTGIDTSSPLDGTFGTSIATGASATITETITPTAANCWMFAFSGLQRISSASTNSTYRSGNAGNGGNLYDSNGAITAGVAYSMVQSISSSGPAGGVAMTLKPSTSSTTIKTVDGVTRANVKTFLGVASASIKTINGIT